MFKALSSEEKQELAYLVKEPGWKVLYKLANVMATEWSSEGLNPDYSKMSDDEIIKNIILHKGMREGLFKFLNKIQAFKRDEKREADKKELSDK